MRKLFAHRNFRLLWIGELLSMIGDQFHLIALPWLVLQLTGDAFATGAVLAAASVPRALFMLLGGAVTDRFSPRLVMLASNFARLVLSVIIGMLVLGGNIEMWMIYVLALSFGVSDAFFYPAQLAILPRVVTPDLLAAGNALQHGGYQLSMFVGPALAGLLIAGFSGSEIGAEMADQTGIGYAFLFDAATFLASAATLMALRISNDSGIAIAGRGQAVLGNIWDGIVAAWADRPLRLFLILLGLDSLLTTGPISVGIPVMAHDRFVEGAVALGVITSAKGMGALVGSLLAGLWPPTARWFGPVTLAALGWPGICLIMMAYVPTTTGAAILALAMGVSGGYFLIVAVVWLQARTPSAMMGRVMSLVMLAVVGLAPISQSASGMLIDISLVALFTIAGGFIALFCVAMMLFSPTIKAMGVLPALSSEKEMR